MSICVVQSAWSWGFKPKPEAKSRIDRARAEASCIALLCRCVGVVCQAGAKSRRLQTVLTDQVIGPGDFGIATSPKSSGEPAAIYRLISVRLSFRPCPSTGCDGQACPGHLDNSCSAAFLNRGRRDKPGDDSSVFLKSLSSTSMAPIRRSRPDLRVRLRCRTHGRHWARSGSAA
jgi:hypothetical protein